uniref:Uncharacterized protein n=1 Tax=Parascaris equorum TaxID=6256 RepID=A0A914RQ33_PAREQ
MCRILSGHVAAGDELFGIDDKSSQKEHSERLDFVLS